MLAYGFLEIRKPQNNGLAAEIWKIPMANPEFSYLSNMSVEAEISMGKFYPSTWLSNRFGKRFRYEMTKRGMVGLFVRLAISHLLL